MAWHLPLQVRNWIPAYAGMTSEGTKRKRLPRRGEETEEGNLEDAKVNYPVQGTPGSPRAFRPKVKRMPEGKRNETLETHIGIVGTEAKINQEELVKIRRKIWSVPSVDCW